MKLVFLLEVFIAHLLYCTGIYWLRRRFLERRGVVVVLVYHRVLSGRRGTGEMVAEESLEWQMRYIREKAKPVEWESVFTQAQSAPKIRVIVTFDDGYRDNFARALPILERYRIPAVFFATTNLVFGRERLAGDDGSTDSEIFPSSEDLQRAKESPYITYGNHTASHGIVSRAQPDVFENELLESQKIFRERLGIIPEVFAYPRGRKGDVTEEAVPVLEKLNMQAAFTMIPGLVDSKTDRYAIPRIGVSHVNNRILFKVKMLGLLNSLVSLKNLLSP